MIKKVLITIVGFLKAFWDATVKTAWGIVAVYFLAGMVRSMDIDATRITNLLTMSAILIKYWVVFWIAFLTRSLYNEIRFEVIE